MTRSTKPRGIRNNNPGNIRKSDVYVWKGQSGVDPAGYCIYERPEYGIRAMSILLQHYEALDGCRTIAEIIHRWAPPSENDTQAYIDSVAAQCRTSPNVAINLHSIGTQLIRAIIFHENGQQPYSDEVIARGMHLAHEH